MLSVDLSKEQLTFEKPRVLFTRAFYPGFQGRPNYNVSADGKRFLLLEQLDTAQPVIGVLQGYQQLRK